MIRTKAEIAKDLAIKQNERAIELLRCKELEIQAKQNAIPKKSYSQNKTDYDRIRNITYSVKLNHAQIDTLISYMDMMEDDEGISLIFKENLMDSLKGADST